MSRTISFQILENATQLKKLMNTERNAQKRTKIQVLYLLKTSEKPSLSDIASITGKNRVTLYRWLKIYQTKGLDPLLDDSGRKRCGRKKLFSN